MCSCYTCVNQIHLSSCQHRTCSLSQISILFLETKCIGSSSTLSSHTRNISAPEPKRAMQGVNAPPHSLQVQDYAYRNDMFFVEASAQTADSINQLFEVDFTVRHLSSSVQAFPNQFNGFSSGQSCIAPLTRQCSANSQTTWTMCATFPEYVVALTTVVGSVFFTIFGGVGIACLPLGLIFSFFWRPKSVITHPQYVKEATKLGMKANELKKAAEALHQE